MNFVDIDLMFTGLMKGDGSVINPDNINCLNQEALRIYNIPQLESGDINELKKIIMICNVLYNRTDMTVLPIEDGFYDLLLEKYKTYDKEFQVGSAVVNFRNFIENDITINAKIARPAVSFSTYKPRDEMHQEVYDQINRTGQDLVTKYDFYRSPISFESDYITKRSHNTEHNHPSLVGTLDKAKFVTNQDAIDVGAFDDSNVKILERDFFQDHINKGIISPNQELEIVVELKYDGISVEADCGFEVESARTRGDTGIGVASDISPILKGYIFKNASCMIGEEPVGVKFEAIMTKSALYKFNEVRGRSYANCRTAIVGLFGASDAYMFRDYITLVPLAIDREQFKYKFDNRLQEIDFMNRVFVTHGEPLRYCVFKGTVPELLYQIKVFWDEAKVSRDYLNFMYDGIVVSYLDEGIRAKLGRENYINKFSMAVKFDPLEKQTMFRGYTYEVGQHGNITPMIHYDPVEFLGTIHTKSTGSSYKRFQELGLKYGDFINVKYVNDVMPYVSRVECEHNAQNPNPLIEFPTKCPVCGSDLVLSESGKTAICTNNECPARSNQRMVNMFSKLNIKGFADAAFLSLKKTHLWELANITREELVSILGEADGNNFYIEMQKFMTEPQKDYIVMGALGFTSMAYKKWQTILEKITIKDLYTLFTSTHPDKEAFKRGICNIIPNLGGTVTLDTIANEFEFFIDDILFIITSCPNIIDSFGSSNEGKIKIRFSGVRNLQLSQQLCNAGYDADQSSSVTNDTDILLIPYDGFNSSKVAKASKNPKTKIIPIQDFIDNMSKYGIQLN